MAFRTFSSNSFKASCLLESSEMTEVNGHGLGTGLFGMIVSVAEFEGIPSGSLTSEAGIMVSVVDVASFLRD